MALCIQLTPIGYREPMALAVIDAAICQNVGLPFSETKYAEGWFDIVGFLLATGKTFAQVTDRLREQQDNAPPEWRDDYYTLIRINHYLMCNYTTNTWVQIGRGQ